MLVATLLRVKAGERPDPDTIVQHPFFSMQGGIAIPSRLDKESIHHKTLWLLDSRPYGDVMSFERACVRFVSFSKECRVRDGKTQRTTSLFTETLLYQCMTLAW